MGVTDLVGPGDVGRSKEGNFSSWPSCTWQGVEFVEFGVI